jgi:DNA-binding NtrC family response regulator
MNRLARRYGVPAPRFSSVLLDACQRHAWPGNLRDLENFAKRFLAHSDEAAALRELSSHPPYGSPNDEDGNGNGNGKNSDHPSNGRTAEGTSLKLLVRDAKGEAERGAIVQALERTRWNRKAAARQLNVSYRALLYKIQEYGLTPPRESARLVGTGDLRQTT